MLLCLLEYHGCLVYVFQSRNPDDLSDLDKNIDVNMVILHRPSEQLTIIRIMVGDCAIPVTKF